MVGPAPNVPAIQSTKSADSTESLHRFQPTFSETNFKKVSSWRNLKASWKPTGEPPPLSSMEVPPFSDFTAFKKSTNAEIPSNSQESDGTAFSVLFSPQPNMQSSVTRITQLPSRGRLVTAFEPHLRQSTVQNLQSLFTQFRYAIGQPKAAVAKAELVDTLTKAYKKSALDPETRNFASAVTLLQEFLRPHWSDIDGKKVEAVSDSLGTLISKSDLSSSVLEGFYRNLLGIVGTGLSVEGIDISDTDDDGDDDDAE